jgi:hypothetical protein
MFCNHGEHYEKPCINIAYISYATRWYSLTFETWIREIRLDCNGHKFGLDEDEVAAVVLAVAHGVKPTDTSALSISQSTWCLL